MIITEKIIVTISNKNLLKYYNSKGYNIKMNDKIEVPTAGIHHNTTNNHRINIKCDICEKAFTTTSATYINKFKNKKQHACVQCRANYHHKKQRQSKPKKITKEQFIKLFKEV